MAATPLGPIVFRIPLSAHPEEGVTGVLVFENDKPTMKVTPTPEEVERVRADLERRRAARLLWKGGAAANARLRGGLGSWKLRAKEVAAARPVPHTLCFAVNVCVLW